MMKNLLVFLLLLPTISMRVNGTYYFENDAPVDYCSNDMLDESNSTRTLCQTKIDVYVNRLTSTKTLIPRLYHSFDFCTISEKERKSYPVQNFGQTLSGDWIELAPFKINVSQGVLVQEICTKTYRLDDLGDQAKLDSLRQAAKMNYQHHWIIDNLKAAWCYEVEGDETYCVTNFPVGCHVDNDGRRLDACVISYLFDEPGASYIFNHLDIVVGYHRNNPPSENFRIVSVKVTPQSLKYALKRATIPMSIPANITGDLSISYTYSVRFELASIKWSSRWNYLIDSMPHTNTLIMSTANSLTVLCFLLFATVFVGYRIYQNPITQKELDDFEKSQEELILLPRKFRWKLISGEVFRAPPCLLLLSIFSGCGVHLLLTLAITLLVALGGFLSAANPGALVMCALITYISLSPVDGFVAVHFYKGFGGCNVKLCALGCSSFFPGLFLGVLASANVLYVFGGSHLILPLSAIGTLIALWLGVSVPLTLLGSYLGSRRKFVARPKNDEPRKSHRTSFCRRSLVTVPVGGLLPFGCIFIPQFFMQNSLWSEHSFTLFGFSFLTCGLVVLTTATVSILVCHCRFCSENPSWAWHAFQSAGSTGVYSFLYCTYYYFQKMEVVGISGRAVYFIWIILGCFAQLLMLGAVGLFVCSLFVQKLYTVRKSPGEKQASVVEVQMADNVELRPDPTPVEESAEEPSVAEHVDSRNEAAIKGATKDDQLESEED